MPGALRDRRDVRGCSMLQCTSTPWLASDWTESLTSALGRGTSACASCARAAGRRPASWSVHSSLCIQHSDCLLTDWSSRRTPPRPARACTTRCARTAPWRSACPATRATPAPAGRATTAPRAHTAPQVCLSIAWLCGLSAAEAVGTGTYCPAPPLSSRRRLLSEDVMVCPAGAVSGPGAASCAYDCGSGQMS